MVLQALLIAFLLFTAGKKVAYVDLPSPPKTPEPSSNAVAVRGSGVLWHGNAPHPSPGTPTISLKLNRIVILTNDPITKRAVEVFITNTGKAPISIPVGTDPIPILKPTALNRRYFTFTVTLGKNTHVGFAESATSSDSPGTSVTVQPGDEIAFLLPVIMPYRNQSEDEISASLQQFRKVMDKGLDWEETAGDLIKSENSLPLF